MKPFVFRWQRMLQLVGGFERDRRNALAAAVGNLNRAEAELASMRASLEELKSKRHKLLERGVDIREIQDNYYGEVGFDLRIELQQKNIEQLEEIADKRRDELTERMRERKTYQKLRGRAFDEYTVEAKREENREVDDIASIAFRRASADEHSE
jgi:flagellar FliJ protein